MKNASFCISSLYLLLLILQSCSNAGGYSKPRPEKKDIISCPYPVPMQPAQQAFADSTSKPTTLIK